MILKNTPPAGSRWPNEHEAWLAMSVIELLCGLALILPAFKKNLGNLVPVAAAVIAAEMLLFCGLHIYSGAPNYGPMIYWLVVAAICGFITYGRLELKTLNISFNQ